MSTLMDELKETTRPMHDSAEGSAFQELLVKGQLSRELFVQYIVQLYLLHSALEGEIHKHQQKGQPGFTVVSEKQFQVPFLLKDLEYFDLQRKTFNSIPATRTLIDNILSVSNESPVSLLGFHYVLLGSKHGSKLIAKNTRDTYGLPETAGALYFDPYGSNFMEIWIKFKEDMNHLDLSDTDRQAVCQGAITMFKRIGQIGDELMAQQTVNSQ